MRYDDTDLQDRLAGEYVLGTLPERTRRRFVTLMHARPEIRERVVEWQGYLGPLDEEIVSVEPPAGVLQRLRKWLCLEQVLSDMALRRRLTCWRAFGLASAALSQILAAAAIHFTFQPAEMEFIRLAYERRPGYVAVLRDETGTPVLVVTARPGISRLVVEPLSGLTTASDVVLQLWATLREGAAVYPLAAIAGSMAFEIVLTGEEARRMQTAKSLLVSREPATVSSGAGEAGEPAEPILYSGLWVGLKGPPEP